MDCLFYGLAEGELERVTPPADAGERRPHDVAVPPWAAHLFTTTASIAVMNAARISPTIPKTIFSTVR